MSTIHNIGNTFSKDFVKLSGPENYNEWAKAFADIAFVNGYDGLYLGTDDVVEKPTPPVFVPPPHDLPANYQYSLAVYGLQLQDWKDNNEASCLACALLRAAVQPWVWKKLSTEDAIDPCKAWIAISTSNKASDDVLLERSLAKLNIIKLSDPVAIRPFLSQFEEVYSDIQDVSGTFTRSQLVAKMNAALPRQYDYFVQYWKLGHYNAPVTETLFKKYRSLLLNYADDNKERWQERKEADRKLKDNSSKGKNKNNDNINRMKTGRFVCYHCGHAGHTVDRCRYVDKPDTLKCTYADCGKLGHTEDRCHMKARHTRDTKDM
jgi:hypothetical protein